MLLVLVGKRIGSLVICLRAFLLDLLLIQWCALELRSTELVTLQGKSNHLLWPSRSLILICKDLLVCSDENCICSEILDSLTQLFVCHSVACVSLCAAFDNTVLPHCSSRLTEPLVGYISHYNVTNGLYFDLVVGYKWPGLIIAGEGQEGSYVAHFAVQ